MQDAHSTNAQDTDRPRGRAETERAARLKAALKANIARRKAQARTRVDNPADDAPGTEG